MGLFVDGPASTVDDLADQDAGVLNVAETAGINLSTKLRLASEEIQTELRLWLTSRWDSCAGSFEPVLRVEQIVVTPPLKRWQTMHTLALAYRDAYFSLLVDRYQAKWREYAKLAREARENLIANGLGLVADPIAKAAAPLLSTTPGPQSGGTFYARVTWVNAANQEGAPSDASSLLVTDGNLMTVAVTGAPRSATGFNVYAGASLDALPRQNDAFLPITATYLYIPGQNTHGALPGRGQRPDYIRRIARTIPRG